MLEDPKPSYEEGILTDIFLMRNNTTSLASWSLFEGL
jgi:hypothetical protein